MYQIGTDGGYLDRPIAIGAGGVQPALTLMPGERADVIIDFAGLPAGTRLLIRNQAKAPYPDGTPVLANLRLREHQRGSRSDGAADHAGRAAEDAFLRPSSSPRSGRPLRARRAGHDSARPTHACASLGGSCTVPFLIERGAALIASSRNRGGQGGGGSGPVLGGGEVPRHGWARGRCGAMLGVTCRLCGGRSRIPHPRCRIPSGGGRHGCWRRCCSRSWSWAPPPPSRS